MPVNTQQLHRVIFRDIKTNANVETPAKDVLIVAVAILRTDVAEEGAELHMPKALLLITRVEAKVGHRSQSGGARGGAGIQVYEDVRFLDAECRVPVFVPGGGVLRDWTARENG